MKGVIALCLKEVVVNNFGLEKWSEIVAQAGHKRDPMILPISNLEDEVVLGLLSSTCQTLDISLETAADVFGDYWVNVYTQRMYKAYYDGADSARELLLKMDSIHVAVTRNIRNAHPPRFNYTWEDEKTLIIQYTSPRNLIDLFIGLVKGVGKHYDEELRVTKAADDKLRIVFP